MPMTAPPIRLLSRRAFTATALCALAVPARADPRRYRLVREASTVAFHFIAQGQRQSGTLPVETADIRIDPDNLLRSQATVTADVRQIRAGLILITQAIKSANLLDAANHPIVRFRSTSIQLGARGRISEGAQIGGELTLRGVTRPISFEATLSRPAGTPPDDLSVLNITLSGALSRSAFGASGYPDMVEDTVTLDIHAQIAEIR